MPSGIQDSWYASVRIGGIETLTEEMGNLTMVERLGNVWPYFELRLKVANPILIDNFLHTEHDIEVVMGPTFNKAQAIKLRPTKIDVVDDLEDGTTKAVTFTGLLSGFTDYLYTTKVRAFKNQTTGQIISSTLVGDLIPNVEATDDLMTWLQWNITDKAMVDHLWLHSRALTDGGLMVPAIQWDSIFSYLDVEKELQDADPSIIFQPYEVGDDQLDRRVQYSSKYSTMSTGYQNRWAASGRVQSVWDTAKDSVSEIQQVPARSGFNVYPTVQGYSKRLQQGRENDNVYEGFNDSRLNNLTRMAQFGYVDVVVNTSDRVSIGREIVRLSPGRKARLLTSRTALGRRDLRSFEGSDKGAQDLPRESDSLYSGDYLITEIRRVLTNRSYNEVFVLGRPGVQNIPGSV